MKLSINSSHPRHLLVSGLVGYSVIFETENDDITLIGPGIQEEYSALDFPDPEDRAAIAAYLVASLESKAYGN